MNFIILLIPCFVLLMLGLSFLPLSILIFDKLKISSLFAAKVSALLTLSFFAWLLAQYRFFKFSLPLILLIFAAMIFTNLVVYFIFRVKINSILKGKFKSILYVEIFFALLFLFFLFISGFNPDIDTDSERMMDYSFLNLMKKTTAFPVQEPWLANTNCNYYYYGYIIVEVLRKLTFMEYNHFFIPALALLFTLFVFSIFLFIFEITNNFKLSCVAASIICLGGNFVIFFTLIDTVENFSFDWLLSPHIWMGAARAIKYTICEFPWFSFIWGDMHPHFIDIAFIASLLFLFFLLHKKNNLLSIFFSGLFLGTIFSINLWNIISYVFLVFISACVFMITKKKWMPFIWILFIAVLLFLPYTLSIDSRNSSLEFYTKSSAFFEFFSFFGGGLCFFYIFIIYFFIRNCYNNTLIYLIVVSIFSIGTFSVSLFVILSAGLAFFLFKKNFISDFALIFLIAAFALIGFCENFYIKDIMQPPFERMHIVFKMYLPAWIFLGLGIALMYNDNQIFKIKKFKIIIVSIICLCFIYTLIGSLGRFNSLNSEFGFDCEKYIKLKYPYDYKAIQWLKKNVDNDFIVELPGNAYVDNSRISTFTGIPAFLGWANHINIRLNDDKFTARRAAVIKNLYTSNDYNLIKKIINEEKIHLIYNGELEKINYPDAPLEIYKSLGKIIYQNEKVQVFKFNEFQISYSRFFLGGLPAAPVRSRYKTTASR